jgi:hypothetical protein
MDRNTACDFLQDLPSSASPPSAEGTKRDDLPLEAEIPVVGNGHPIFAIFRRAPKTQRHPRRVPPCRLFHSLIRRAYGRIYSACRYALAL